MYAQVHQHVRRPAVFQLGPEKLRAARRSLRGTEAAGTRLAAGRCRHRCWLATRPDGRPHVAGVGAKWIDGRLYFTSGGQRRRHHRP